MIADRVRMSKKKSIPGVPDYVMATDADFSGSVDGDFVYTGSRKLPIIPHKIKGITVTKMFNSAYVGGMFGKSATIVKGVATLEGHSITNMKEMFRESKAPTLDLSGLNTSNVTNMYGMFRSSQATSLDLSSFDTSKVTRMDYMFQNSKATTLDLSSFNTSNVNYMTGMFENCQADILDLSSFDVSKMSVSRMNDMFKGAKATIGYARTQADADKFNASSNKPAGLIFVVK